MPQPTEDIPYSAPGFATPDPEQETEPDQSNQDILKDVQKYLREAIAENNTFDVIDLTETAKMTPTQQIAVHKLVVQHLRNIKSTIDGKIKEL